MKRSIVIIIISFCCGLFINAQDAPGSSDHSLFPRMKGFKLLEYDVREPATHMFYDEEGNEMIISGKMLFYYYESDADLSVAKILSSFTARGKELGARMCAHDGDKLCMIVQQNDVEVWADLSAGDFYYTLRIMEKAEINQEVTPESIGNDLTGKGETILYLRFDYRGATIQPYSVPAVEALAEVLKANPSMKIEIEGHTDNEGREYDNKLISQDRANAVGIELIRLGIARERLAASGMGSAMPAASNETAAGRAQNRRIVIKVIK
jgi:outer membrane protein OmpA-like peptidoglycan-associated protein